MMRFLFAALILAFALPAAAGITTQRKPVGFTEILEIRNTASTNKSNLIEAAAVNGSPDVEIPLDAAWHKLRVFVFVTYAANNNATVVMSCSLDGTNPATLQSRAIASGTSTLSDVMDTKALGSADQDFMVEYDVRGCMTVTLTLGGDDTDVANLQAVAVR